MPNNWLQETQGLCVGGVNTAMRADLIAQDQIVWGTNMTVRDGKPRTRSALVQRSVLPPGRVQGLGYFSQRGGMFVASVAGQLTRVTINGNNVVQLPIPLEFDNAANRPEAWMTETQGSLVIQDGQSNPIIYNGATARRSDLAKKEVPIGTRMAYGNGRLWVVVNGNTLVAGDIVGNGDGSELLFTETTYLSGGGALFYPAPIIALAFLPTNDTATGYGSLIVFGANFTDAVRAEITERDLWQLIPGFQIEVLKGIGVVSSASVTRVNQDLYWRDVGGQIRSLRSARADQLSPGNSPQSREVSRITDFETAAWLAQCGGAYFDNRLYFTASPFLLPNDVIGFKNLISLDCAPLSTMRGKAPPAYDGQYSGANFVRMITGRFNGDPRMFIVSSDDDGQNRLWEVMPGVREDAYQTESYGAVIASRIQCEAEFRRFNFGDPTKLKQIVRADFYPAEISGQVEVSLYWRVGNRNQWQLCDTVSFCAEMEDGTGEGSASVLLSPTNFDNVNWTTDGVAVGAWVTSPAGLNNAQKIVEDFSSGLHGITQVGVHITGGQRNTFEIYAKKLLSRYKGVIEIDDGSGNAIAASFDLDAGTIVTGGGTGDITHPESSIEELDNGWFKLTVSAIFTTDSDAGRVEFLGADAAGSLFYTGSIIEGFEIWFPQAGVLSDATHVWKNLATQERGKIKSFTFPDPKDGVTNFLQTVGYDFQLRLVWTGNMLIDRIDVWALPKSDQPFSNIPETDQACVKDSVTDNVINYRIVP